MSWKFVFNTLISNIGHFQGGGKSDMDNAFDVAKNAGYAFMLWNGDVWHVATKTTTGITQNDLI